MLVQVLLLEFVYHAKPAYPMSHFCSAKTLGLVRELLRLPSNPLDEIDMLHTGLASLFASIYPTNLKLRSPQFS